MKNVTFKNGYLEIDGKKQFAWSGEIQYFRIEKKNWEIILDKVCEGNLNTISTYVPWNWHEYEKGKYDFTGETHPSRDLITFLNMVKERGLNLVIKGGPHIHAEYLNGGIPEWVFRENPQILTLDADGKPNQTYVFYPSITYLHPDYMKLVKDWFAKFVEITLPYENIVMWQIDNEISYNISFFSYIGGEQIYKGDYNPFLVDNGLYQKFLEKRYGKIDVINELYGENNESFAQIVPPKKPVEVGDYAGHNKSNDWVEFRSRLVGMYAHALMEMLYDMGVNGPFSIDDPILHFDTSWRDIYSEIKDSRWEALIGYTFYAGSTIEEGTGAHLKRIELTRASGSPIVSNHEMQAGDMYFLETWKQQASDYDLLWKMGIGYGNNMINLYWFCDGYNFLGYEHFLPELDLNSPLDKNGNPRQHYYVAKNIGKFVSENSWILDTSVEYDLSVGYYHPYSKALKFNNSMGVDKNEIGKGGIVGSFIDLMGVCNINYKLINLAEDFDNNEVIAKNKLVVILYEYLDEKVQRDLLNFAESGGHLTLLRHIPKKTEGFKDCTILWDALEIEDVEIKKYNPDILYVVNRAKYNDIEFCVCDEIRTYKMKNDDHSVDLTAHPDDKMCGFTKNIGKGKISVIGFIPQVFMSASRDFAREYFNKKSQDGIHIYERKNGDKSLFTVCNMFENPGEVIIGDNKFDIPPRKGTFIIKSGNEYKVWEE